MLVSPEIEADTNSSMNMLELVLHSSWEGDDDVSSGFLRPSESDSGWQFTVKIDVSTISSSSMVELSLHSSWEGDDDVSSGFLRPSESDSDW